MKVLITGGCGFLGHHIVEHFLRNTDAELVLLDKMTYASAGFDRLRDIAAFDDKRVRVLGADLAQQIPWGVVREIGAVDYVIHAAAETHVDRSIEDPVPFIQSNVMGTHNLLWWVKRLDVMPKRVFLVSTDEVYGPATWESTGNVETDTYRPANPYAAAKAGGEMLAWAYANTYKLPLTIVNTMNLIGERQAAEKYFPLVIRKVITGEKLLVHADPTRTRSGTRFYIHCRNFASAILFLIGKIESCFDGVPRGQFGKVHVSGEKELSNLELAQMIADIIGKPLDYELVDFHTSRPGHDLRYALDASLIRRMGWKQPIDIEKSVEKTVKWFLDHPRWLES